MSTHRVRLQRSSSRQQQQHRGTTGAAHCSRRSRPNMAGALSCTKKATPHSLGWCRHAGTCLAARLRRGSKRCGCAACAVAGSPALGLCPPAPTSSSCRCAGGLLVSPAHRMVPLHDVGRVHACEWDAARRASGRSGRVYSGVQRQLMRSSGGVSVKYLGRCAIERTRTGDRTGRLLGSGKQAPPRLHATTSQAGRHACSCVGAGGLAA
jgi:hypothetical protein